MSITDLITSGDSPNGRGLGGFVLGTVSENDNQDFPGMVKVAFTAWTSGGEISKWMPVLSPYAGKEYGSYLIPEVNDIVLVGFIGPMMEQPFVLGSFYPAEAKLPKDQFDKKNINRYFKTMGGVSFAVSDEKNKQKMEAMTPKGLKISAEDENEVITVTDKNGKNLVKLDCKSGAITVTADKKITLKAGPCEICMDGGGPGTISVKAGQINAEGKQTVSVKSNNMLTVEGGMATVEGKQTLTLKGSAMCEISGGLVKIN